MILVEIGFLQMQKAVHHPQEMPSVSKCPGTSILFALSSGIENFNSACEKQRGWDYFAGETLIFWEIGWIRDVSLAILLLL